MINGMQNVKLKNMQLACTVVMAYRGTVQGALVRGLSRHV